MNVYVDSSVLLRIVLDEPNRLGVWPSIDRPISSELLRVETLRTLDRARVRLRLPDEDVARQHFELFDRLDRIDLIDIDKTVLSLAAKPFPTVVGSLDAIHLASAMLAREEIDDLGFATHDQELARAAVSLGFDVHTA